jgi:hypothetical protein
MGLVSAQPYKIRLWDEVALNAHRTSPEVAKQIALAQKTFASRLTEYDLVNWSRLLHADIPSALAPTVIGIGACGASHHWARILRRWP